MQRKNKVKLLTSWLKWRSKMMAGILLLMVNYVIVAALMHMNLDAVIYSTLLGCFVGAWLGVWDFYSYAKRMEMLYRTYLNCHHTLEMMPTAKQPIETMYQEIITALNEELGTLKNQTKRQAEEMQDYYTLWTHQIKTPIAAMHLVLQNQKYQQQERQEGSMILQLEGELFKVEQYVEMAMQYLRLGSMSQDLVLKKYELYEIVTKALQKQAVSFVNKKLSIDLQPFEKNIITDEKWLQFVIEQLISNSIKYTQSGGITIRLDEKGRLEIKDTGIGIQSEDLPRIFDRGFTGYNGRMHKKSTGIGLYLCKEVIQKLSHLISVESKVGEGTSVYLSFPTDEIM